MKYNYFDELIEEVKFERRTGNRSVLLEKFVGYVLLFIVVMLVLISIK